MAAASLLAPSAGTIGSASLWMRSTGRGAIAPTTSSARPRLRCMACRCSAPEKRRQQKLRDAGRGSSEVGRDRPALGERSIRHDGFQAPVSRRRVERRLAAHRHSERAETTPGMASAEIVHRADHVVRLAVPEGDPVIRRGVRLAVVPQVDGENGVTMRDQVGREREAVRVGQRAIVEPATVDHDDRGLRSSGRDPPGADRDRKVGGLERHRLEAEAEVGRGLGQW